MVSRQALTEKVMVIGIDGMDPSLTKKYMDMGKLPNIEKLVKQGAAREDLAFLGNVPNITPPMWTTLATGATPATHGITCFWRQGKERLDEIVYNLDSRNCTAEPVWNVLAESGKKTLVFNWPGSAWPPTSDSPNLHVIDGTSPGSVNTANAQIDAANITVADIMIQETLFRASAPVENGAGCILKDVPASDEEGKDITKEALSQGGMVNFVMTHADGEGMIEDLGKDVFNSPLKPAQGWANAPKNAKEFSFHFCNGLVRRPALLCCDENGVYNEVKIYKSKKDVEPMCVVTDDQQAFDIVDNYNLGDQEVTAARSFHIMSIDSAGNNVRMFVSDALDITNDSVWHPKNLFKEVVDNVGYPPAFNSACGKHPLILEKAMFPAWRHVGEWQAKAILYLAKEKGYQAVFSHFHNLDAFGHTFFTWAKQRERFDGDEKYYQGLIEQAYIDTDDYIGHYMPLLNEGWTLFIVSDHGLLSAYEEEPPYLGDPFGININVLKELGYSVLQKDADGQEIRAFDWEKTRAVATRGTHIWINLKGRDKTGIVEPEDKYELERQIISDLYNYRDPHTGKRVVSLVLRNKDAQLLGMGGSECGDIIYFLEEGFNRGHGDSLPTFKGYANTSVAPIFIACGKGIKEGFTTKRQIRQTDLAPTIAVLMGIRMPAQNEGSIVHEILTEEF